MKKTSVFIFALMAAVFVTPGLAAETRPAPTSPDSVATTFLKLTRQKPDFRAIARQDPAYLTAPDFSRQAIFDRLVREQEEAYKLHMPQEPIVVETAVTLSPYSFKYNGFFIENFKPGLFFPVESAGRCYAIVPQAIEDRQWLNVADLAIAKAIDAASGRSLKMVLLLSPKYADGRTPARLNGKDCWLIATEVRNMMLYAADKSEPLWQASTDTPGKEEYKNLLDLYKGG